MAEQGGKEGNPNEDVLTGVSNLAKDPAEQILQTFKYRKNQIYQKLLQGEREKEATVILQTFKFLVENELV